MEHGDWKSFHEAAVEGDLDLVAFYVRQGVDVNYAHPEFMTNALVSAILAGNEPIAIYLLDHGADPLLISPLDEMNALEAATKLGQSDVISKIETQT